MRSGEHVQGLCKTVRLEWAATPATLLVPAIPVLTKSQAWLQMSEASSFTLRMPCPHFRDKTDWCPWPATA
jgi:hypothetical protein